MWDLRTEGVLRLPSGSLVRGRALRDPIPGGPRPDLGVYLQGRDPGGFDWDSRWVRWPDFWLPSDSKELGVVLREALRRCVTERVEIACTGGVGRTGTALACLVALDGMPGSAAVDYVRRHYSQRAMETPWQKRFAKTFVKPGSLL
ncbi:phosphatase [Rhodococcus sp. 06-412-2C]|uniref:protein-tyrosine phosphatase family protein n=1 Tax=unclassified Rhodococcus (in: high G+C Gram-positive bacteria) TaxID=192944 RepID=UPI000B9A5925|nr:MULTISPECIES: protein-tyrosine phosphatase family protein [unclassified Rhodococcus (in: high G+C Gram-positive bacteria)]OZC83733.1 phosphatase [Rhodococcus sp. 06-412-2C]OZC93920.1 phosphatase [Rhodococcus sp. 06-412-2B]